MGPTNKFRSCRMQLAPTLPGSIPMHCGMLKTGWLAASRRVRLCNAVPIHQSNEDGAYNIWGIGVPAVPTMLEPEYRWFPRLDGENRDRSVASPSAPDFQSFVRWMLQIDGADDCTIAHARASLCAVHSSLMSGGVDPTTEHMVDIRPHHSEWEIEFLRSTCAGFTLMIGNNSPAALGRLH